MLIADKIRIRNFQSYGNIVTEFDLNSHKKVLLQGLNGSGKSTLLVDALSFNWFGKAYRDITKSAMVNSVNGNNTVTETEFRNHGKHIRIVRGISPNILEVYEDGVLTNAESSVRETQSRIERDLLGFDYTGFKQFVCLSIVSYEPFMRLGSPEKRKVLESLFDISYFTKLENEFKARLTVLNATIRDLEFEESQLSSYVDGYEKTLADMDVIVGRDRAELEAEQQELLTSIESLQDVIADIKAKDDPELEDEHQTLRTDIVNLNQKMVELQVKHQAHREFVNFLKTNDECHTCHGSITPAFKADQMKMLKDKVKPLEDEMATIKAQFEAASARFTEINAQVIEQKRRREQILLVSIASLSEKQARLNSLSKMFNSLDDEKTAGIRERHQEVVVKLAEKTKELKVALFKKDILLKSRDVVSDKGDLKLSIIRRHIPHLNKLINDYLDVLGLPVRFVIDEEFNEKVYSRYMDKFTYNSFSEGQKKRIDIAILMAFREIAMTKNSVSTNILVLDEILETSLDPEGAKAVKNLIDILAEKCNIFVISPYDAITRNISFDAIYDVELEGNFTKIGRQLSAS